MEKFFVITVFACISEILVLTKYQRSIMTFDLYPMPYSKPGSNRPGRIKTFPMVVKFDVKARSRHSV